MLILQQLSTRPVSATLLRARTQRGISLIEVVIGMVIVGMLFALGAPSFFGWIQNSKIRTAAEGIQSGLQLARAEAVRRNATVQFALVNDLTSSCAFSATGTNWIVSQDDATGKCNVDPDPTAAPRTVQKSTSAAGGAASLTVSASLSGTGVALPNAIIFNGLGRLAAGSNIPAGSAAWINISNPTAGACVAASGSVRCMRVEVTTAGQIRMCDTAVAFSTTSPQGC